MIEESDARIERLEKASQDQQGQLAEIIELLKTLVRDKAQVAGQQNSVVQPEQRREDLVYPQGFTPVYTQAQPMPQMGGFSYGYAPPDCGNLKDRDTTFLPHLEENMIIYNVLWLLEDGDEIYQKILPTIIEN